MMRNKTIVIVSRHAFRRYRQRVDPKATHGEIVKKIKLSQIASERQIQLIVNENAKRRHRGKHKAFNNPNRFFYWCFPMSDSKTLVFATELKRPGVYVLITCWFLTEGSEKE